MEKKFFKSATSRNPLSGAVLAGDTLYVSGQLGIDPAAGSMAVGDAAQTAQAMKNLQAQVEGAGLTLEDVVKTTIYVAAETDTTIVNQVYASFFSENYPARLMIRAAFPNPAVRVEVEAIAVR